jgi:hypothetical protein
MLCVAEYAPELQEASKWLCGPAPKNATDPCLAFLSNEHRFSHFLIRPYQMAQKIDTQSNVSAYKSGDNQRRAAAALLEEYGDLVAEMVLTRSVDDFLTYVSHLMKLLFQQKPEILQSAVQVRLDDILRLPDRDAVIQYAIDDYVRKLSYQSLSELYRDLKVKTSFRLFTSENLLNVAIEAVAIRNVLVHNNGMVDARLADLVSRYRGHEGHRVGDFDAVGFRNHLIRAVIDIDQRARTKWTLPAGSGEVPHLCHRFDMLLPEVESTSRAESETSRERMQTGPTCERCHKPTIRCDVCKGGGQVMFTFGGCTECAATGWVCPDDGKFWNS